MKILNGLLAVAAGAKGFEAEEELHEFADFLENQNELSDADKEKVLYILFDNSLVTIDRHSLPDWRQTEYDDLMKLFHELDGWWQQHHNGKHYPDI